MRFGFTRREIRALAILLPVLTVSAWIIIGILHGKTSRTEILYAMTVSESQSDVSHIETATSTTGQNSINPFTFDPNTVSYQELRQMGVDKKTSVNIIKYRNAGKVFRIKEDLATCYGMTDSLYSILSGYITIGESYTIKPKNNYGMQKSDAVNQADTRLSAPTQFDYTNRQYESDVHTTGSNKKESSNHQEPALFVFDPNKADKATFTKLGFTQRQAEIIIKYRESCNGYRNAEHFGRCYAVSPQMLERLKPYIKFSIDSDKTELNRADSTSLVAINGIGAWSASQIIMYRNRLGGYSDMGQLLDLRAITEENYKKIYTQIWIDTCIIQKIDINFATSESLARHPYITGARLRKILKTRQLKGGWDTIEDMINDNTLTVEEAKRLAPYLQFIRIEP